MKFEVLAPVMDERLTRLWAAAEAEAYGRGGNLAVTQATGILGKRILAGKRDLAALRENPPTEPAREQRIRKPGAGRKRLEDVQPELVKALAPALPNADDAVKTASTKLLEKAKCSESRDLLLGFATSLNAGVRRAALRALSVGTTLSRQPTALRSETLARDFDQRSLDEKKMLFVALARVEGPLAARFLARILDQRKWFEKSARSETRACAAVALGEIEDDEAVAALERHVSDKSQTVRTAVGVALSHSRRSTRVPETAS